MGAEKFLSTPSARRATSLSFLLSTHTGISIHALREEGDRRWGVFVYTSSKISIHALREEGDVALAHGYVYHQISIHALREEGDLVLGRDIGQNAQFLSTPSARRATRASCRSATRTSDFYPRPPRGGRRKHRGQNLRLLQFLSTPSARRATRAAQRAHSGRQISIHALREEGDCCSTAQCTRPRKHFYPRPPRGGRQAGPEGSAEGKTFLSTPSARRATA